MYIVCICISVFYTISKKYYERSYKKRAEDKEIFLLLKKIEETVELEEIKDRVRDIIEIRWKIENKPHEEKKKIEKKRKKN